MDLYIDIKYLSLIGNSLDKFVKKNDKLWNCRCPICGDSTKNKNKCRGYFYIYKQCLNYKCHNCDASMSFMSFLKNHNGLLYQEYYLEQFKKTDSPRNMEDPPAPPKPTFTPKRLIDQLMDRLDSLPDDNIAVKYARDRKIPENRFSDLYYVENFKDLEQLSEKYRNKITGKEPRLVLPFFDWKGQMIGLSGRALNDHPLRYVTLKLNEDDLLIFGTESVDISKHVYVVEGPIDSLFIDNCIAVAGTGFTRLHQLNIDKKNLTIIIDNQPRNSEVVKVYRRFIQDDFNVFIWPYNLPGKDINDLVKNGMTTQQIKYMIDSNTYSGLESMAHFNMWKKI